LADERTRIVVGDVRDVVAARPDTSLDAIVLDVDNGPDFLVHDVNAAVYESDFVEVCAARLKPYGHLCVWSMPPSASLTATLSAAFTNVKQEAVAVELQGRAEHYWIVSGTRQDDVIAPY
jgi:spermidine synthase